VIAVLLCAMAAAGALPAADLYLQASNAEVAGRHAEASAAYARVAEAGGPLAPYAKAGVAQAQARLGNKQEAVERYRRLLAEQPEGPWVRMAQTHLGTLLLELNQPNEAIPLLRNILGIYPHPWWMDTYIWPAADLMLRHPSTQGEGYAFFNRVASSTIYIQPRLDAARRLINSPSPDDQAVAIAAMLRSNATTEAGKALFVALAGLSPQNGQPKMLPEIMPVVFASTTGEAQALQSLETLAQANPGCPWVRLWLTYSARNLTSNGSHGHAEAAATVLARHYPASREAGETLWWLGNHYKGKNQMARAMWAYRMLANECPANWRAPHAKMEIIDHLRGTGQHDAARDALLRLGADFGNSRFRPEAYYTAANLELAAGNRDRAREYFQAAAHNKIGDFFAHRALDRLEVFAPNSAPMPKLNIDGRRPVLRPGALEVPPLRALPAFIEENPRVQRLRFFGRHGIQAGEWEALDLLLQLRQELNPGLFYRVVAEAGYAHVAWQFANAHGWGVQDGEMTVERLRIEFPLAYWPETKALAAEMGVDPFLILAVAKQESTFRAGVQSHAGATGVMQLMPATANWLADVDAQVAREHVANLKSPINSIRLGAVYLRRMISRSDVNLIHALASYNAGPGNNDKWKARFPNYGVDEYIEAIPFSETKDYVKKVLGNYMAYHTLYPDMP